MDVETWREDIGANAVDDGNAATMATVHRMENIAAIVVGMVPPKWKQQWQLAVDSSRSGTKQGGTLIFCRRVA